VLGVAFADRGFPKPVDLGLQEGPFLLSLQPLDGVYEVLLPLGGRRDGFVDRLGRVALVEQCADLVYLFPAEPGAVLGFKRANRLVDLVKLVLLINPVAQLLDLVAKFAVLEVLEVVVLEVLVLQILGHEIAAISASVIGRVRSGGLGCRTFSGSQVTASSRVS